MTYNKGLATNEDADYLHQALETPVIATNSPVKERDLNCPCCTRKFAQFYDVIRHLESGGCKSGITSHQISMLTYYLFKIDDFYECPRADCHREIFKLSSFLQHLKYDKRCNKSIENDFIARMTAHFLHTMTNIMCLRYTVKGCLIGVDLVEEFQNIW